jgi:hypothetical protein
MYCEAMIRRVVREGSFLMRGDGYLYGCAAIHATILNLVIFVPSPAALFGLSGGMIHNENKRHEEKTRPPPTVDAFVIC